MDIDQNKYSPTDNFFGTVWRSIVWGLIGIMFGNIIKYVSPKFETKYVYFNVALQLTVVSIATSIIYYYVNNYFGWTWQNTVPGLFFVSFFFGSQSCVFESMKKVKYL